MKAPEPWPPPPPLQLKVVFLDFDGVLNSAEYTSTLNPDALYPKLSTEWWAHGLDPKAIERLNVLLERTGAKVVVSSSWRINTTVEWLREVLESRGFRGKVIGMTEHYSGAARCEEISAWLQGRPVKSFVIFDDDEDASIEGHFIRTDFEVGLTPEHVDQAVAILDASPSSASHLTSPD